jgi:hypothetical protein
VLDKAALVVPLPVAETLAEALPVPLAEDVAVAHTAAPSDIEIPFAPPPSATVHAFAGAPVHVALVAPAHAAAEK